MVDKKDPENRRLAAEAKRVAMNEKRNEDRKRREREAEEQERIAADKRLERNYAKYQAAIDKKKS